MPPVPSSRDRSIAIIGAGFSGIGMGIALQKAGFENFTIFEKGRGPGGVWRDNTYPGAACDIPSVLYSFSFEQRCDWSRTFPKQLEILSYLKNCAEKYGLLDKMRCQTEITEAAFDDANSSWNLTTGDGETFQASVVMFACGQLDRPLIPDLPGIDAFEGNLFHSARWDHHAELKGRRIAVIGNGASAIQFVPHLAKVASHLTIFQRSPNWISRKRDKEVPSEKKVRLHRFPWLQKLNRLSAYLSAESRFALFLPKSAASRLMGRYLSRHLKRRVSSPRLFEKLRPSFEVGCKRILLSNDWFKTLQLPNVSIESSGAASLSANEVIAGDGRNISADVVIFATGFKTNDFLAPIEIRGKGGIDLQEQWRQGAEAYLGMTVTGFPNFFMLYGPNTNLGHNSIIMMIENQARYIVQALQWMDLADAKTLEVREEELQSFNQIIQQKAQKTVWAANCSSWYKNDAGKIINNWPMPSWRYRLATHKLKRSAFRIS